MITTEAVIVEEDKPKGGPAPQMPQNPMGGMY
jgi:hypothetical protein